MYYVSDIWSVKGGASSLFHTFDLSLPHISVHSGQYFFQKWHICYESLLIPILELVSKILRFAAFRITFAHSALGTKYYLANTK